ncbi:MAG: CDP-alcohol phosphatidyltransferase family protein [Candidatus Dormibacteria bacterium]
MGLALGEGFTIGIAVVHGSGVLVPAMLGTLVWWLIVMVFVVGGAAWLDTPDGQQLDHYGIPNGLSAIRTWMCVPLFYDAIFTLPGRLALILWAGVAGAVGLLDVVDGFLARRIGPVSVLGKAIDPFGDALFLVTAAIGSYLLGMWPLWLMAFVIFRYAGPLLLTPIVLLTGRRPELVHTVWGRRNTLLTGVVLFTLYWVRIADGPVWLAALFAAIPTLVPTAILHFVQLARRTFSAPVVQPGRAA